MRKIKHIKWEMAALCTRVPSLRLHLDSHVLLIHHVCLSHPRAHLAVAKL